MVYLSSKVFKVCLVIGAFVDGADVAVGHVSVVFVTHFFAAAQYPQSVLATHSPHFP